MKQLLLGIALALLSTSPAGAVEPQTPVEPELRELLKKAAHESDSFVDRFDGDLDERTSLVLGEAVMTSHILDDDYRVVDQNSYREDQCEKRYPI